MGYQTDHICSIYVHCMYFKRTLKCTYSRATRPWRAKGTSNANGSLKEEQEEVSVVLFHFVINQMHQCNIHRQFVSFFECNIHWQCVFNNVIVRVNLFIFINVTLLHNVSSYQCNMGIRYSMQIFVFCILRAIYNQYS